MNKTDIFIGSFCAWLLGFVLYAMPAHIPSIEEKDNPPLLPPAQPFIPAPIQPSPQQNTDPELAGVQVPIPKDCRVFNKSGVQCVWCSIESLCRYHKVTEGYDLTQHYTWATGPGEVQRVLSSRYPNIKWKQIQSRSQLKSFVKKYVAEKKFGVGLAIPGHMLNLVHYDEATGTVKIIDNCGPMALKVQNWSMDKFDQIADGWALTVFPPGYSETGESFDCTISDPGRLYGFLFLSIFSIKLKY